MALNSLVFSNFLHRPARTIASVFGISIGVLLIVFTVGISNGTMRERAKRAENINAELIFCRAGSVCFMGNSSFNLEISEAKKIEQVDGVKTVEPIGQTLVASKDTRMGERFLDGVRFDSYAPLVGLRLIDGRVFNAGAKEALIDTGFQEQNEYKIGDTLSLWEQDFEIVGTYEPAAGSRVKVPLSTMQELTGGENKATGFMIKIKEGQTVDTVATNISKAYPDDRLILTKDIEEFYMNSMPAIGVFLNVIIGVAAGISILVILLTMYTTVTERTRQIGIMKSLGMSNRDISWTITKEALLISLAGIILGVILTLILRYVLSLFISINLDLSYGVIALITIIGLLGGVIGALYPASRAVKLDPVEALNYD